MEYNQLYNLTARQNFPNPIHSNYDKKQINEHLKDIDNFLLKTIRSSSVRSPKNSKILEKISNSLQKIRSTSVLNENKSIKNVENEYFSSEMLKYSESKCVPKSFEVICKNKGKITQKNKIEEIYEHKNLSYLISLSQLEKATNIIQKQGTSGLSYSYIRQLKQFCNLALNSTKNNI